MSKTDLSLHILKEFHGEPIEKVGECLIKNCSATLKQLSYATRMPQSKVQRTLLVLIQHGMVEFNQNKHGIIEYKLYIDRVLYRLQFPKVVQCAAVLYGDVAKMMVEMLLCEGHASLNNLVTTVTEQVNEMLKAQGAETIQPSLVRDKFERMVMTHFIKRCSTPIRDSTGRVVSLQPPSETLMFSVPKDLKSGRVRVKQEGEDTEEPTTKKRRINATGDYGTLSYEGEVMPGSYNGTEDTEIYWEVNYPKFILHFRNQELVSAVASRLDSEKAAEVLRTILRYCEKTIYFREQVTQPITFYEIQSQLPRDLGMAKQTLEQWLKIITENMPEFLTKTADSGGGSYSVNIFQALQALCTAHIESVVEERFGSKSLRIFRVILQKKQVEQSTIEQCVLMPAKEAKELLYRMFREHFVHVTELSKTPDHAPSRTYYLFNVDIKKVARMLLERSYKALKNIMIKRQLVLTENRRLLDKEKRVNAIKFDVEKRHKEHLARLAEGDGVPEGVEDELKAELEVIETMIVPSEQEQLNKVNKFSTHLEASELQLNSTIFLLECFLDLTYKPPVPKLPKNFLG